MRKDMNKVLTERPRAGGRGPQRQTFEKKTRTRERRYFKGCEVDTSPKKESIRKRHRVSGDYKSFTDHIQPLYRYLISQVGRPWNDVWSDVCQNLKGSGLQAQHVKGHVKQYVEEHVEYDEDGIPRRKNFYSWSSSEVDGLYVCPDTGLLKEHRRKSYHHNPGEPNYVTLDGKKYIRTEHGWFEIELDPVEQHWVRNPDWGKVKGARYNIMSNDAHWDALHKKWMTVDALRSFYGRNVRCVGKRALSKKEIKRLNLNK